MGNFWSWFFFLYSICLIDDGISFLSFFLNDNFKCVICKIEINYRILYIVSLWIC